MSAQTSEIEKAAHLEVEGAASGNGNWDGVAMLHGKLYCCPYNASGVLVLDPASGDALSTIECQGMDLRGDWRGIAACAGKLYCAPAKADSVLVIDPSASPAISTIDANARSGNAHNWDGIAVCGGLLYCAPFNAASVLVVEPKTQGLRTIKCGNLGEGKWSGIAACRGKVYCAPHNAAAVLVVDPSNDDDVSFLDVAYVGDRKWSGICACRGKLYCAPFNATSVLAIDPNASPGAIRLIDVNILGDRRGHKRVLQRHFDASVTGTSTLESFESDHMRVERNAFAASDLEERRAPPESGEPQDSIHLSSR